MQCYAIAISSTPIVAPDVVNPAVDTQRQEYVDVNPEGEPALSLSEAQPVDHVWLVDFSLELIPQVTGHCGKTQLILLKRFNTTSALLVTWCDLEESN